MEVSFVLTERQLEASYRLAKVYHHGWTKLIPRHKLAVPIAPAKIRCLVEKVRIELGLAPFQSKFRVAPVFNQKGCVEHRSETGRVTWLIDHAGEVTIQITRPQDIVVITAKLRCRKGARGLYWVFYDLSYRGELVHKRHVRALIKTVYPLISYRQRSRFIHPLMEKALSD